MKTVFYQLASVLRESFCEGMKLRIVTPGGIIEGLPVFNDDSVYRPDSTNWAVAFRAMLFANGSHTQAPTAVCDIGDGVLLQNVDVISTAGKLSSDFLFIRYDAMLAITLIQDVP